MRLARVETFQLRVPPVKDFRWQSLLEPLGSYFVVKLTADDRTVGYGETVPIKDWGGDHGRQYGETPVTAAHVVHEYLAPILSTEHPFDVGRLHERWDAHVVGHPYAKAAVDVALYDLAGRKLGVPVHRLLGGWQRERVPIAHMLGILPIDEAVAEASEAASEGVAAFQVKGGRDPQRDEELIGHLRQRLGRDVTLRLDANGGYANPKAAIRAVRAMERHGLDYVEQPVMGKARLAEVTRAVSAGTVADESCWSLADAIELYELRAVDAISIYVGKAGGLYRARAIAAFAAAVGLPHDVNGSLELGIGAAANLHLIAASPNGRLASVTPVNGPAEARASRVAGRYSSDDVIAAPFRFEAGMVVLDERPGLGIEVDEGKLELYTVEHRVSECAGLRVRRTE